MFTTIAGNMRLLLLPTLLSVALAGHMNNTEWKGHRWAGEQDLWVPPGYVATFETNCGWTMNETTEVNNQGKFKCANCNNSHSGVDVFKDPGVQACVDICDASDECGAFTYWVPGTPGGDGISHGAGDVSGVDKEADATEVSTGSCYFRQQHWVLQRFPKTGVTCYEKPTESPTTSPTESPTESPTTSPDGTATGDVHVQHAGGGKSDLKGPGTGGLLILLQAACISLTARFTPTKFTLAPEDTRSVHIMTVDGSFLTEAYATLKTKDGALVQVSYVHRVVLVELVDASGVVLVTTPLKMDMGVVKFGDVSVVVTHPATLTVADAHWQIRVTPGTHRLASDGSRQMHLDVGVIALTDPLLSRVAPHGIIGQGFDDLHIDGKTDDYVPDSAGNFVTSAQGEGAIEGKMEDYIVKEPFSTEFRFGRFNASSAMPRNTTNL